jgi:hypothetical protein
VWESVARMGRKRFIASWVQDVTYLSLHPMPPLLPAYRSKVESRPFAHLWLRPHLMEEMRGMGAVMKDEPVEGIISQVVLSYLQTLPLIVFFLHPALTPTAFPG